MKRKKEKQEQPVQQQSQSEQLQLRVDAVGGRVVIRLSRPCDTIEMQLEDAANFSTAIAERAREAYVQRVQGERDAALKRLDEIDAARKAND